MIQPVCFTWANKILLRTGDDAARAVTLYSMNGASSVLFAFWGIILYPATDAPNRFHKGTIAMFVVAAVLAAWVGVTLLLEKHVARKAAAEEEEAVRDHAVEKDPERESAHTEHMFTHGVK